MMAVMLEEWTRVALPEYWENLTQILECKYFRVSFEKFVTDDYVIDELGFVNFKDDYGENCELPLFASLRDYRKGTERYFICEQNLTFCATFAAVRGLAIS